MVFAVTVQSALTEADASESILPGFPAPLATIPVREMQRAYEFVVPDDRKPQTYELRLGRSIQHRSQAEYPRGLLPVPDPWYNLPRILQSAKLPTHPAVSCVR